MADVRALLAQERQARRINHEYASYTKAGALMCSACQLNIKSEALWEGHLRSANHKANVKKFHQSARTVVKRKIEDVDETQATEDADTRKKLKPKSRTPSETVTTSRQEIVTLSEQRIEDQYEGEAAGPENGSEPVQPAKPSRPYTVPIDAARAAPIRAPAVQVDEDEWAAFERDVAPLVQLDYSAATITAAPVSAAQLEAETELDRKRLKDSDADDEKEDEGRRMEEEFDVMEEMEERVRKLKEKREALRLQGQAHLDTGQSEGLLSTNSTSSLNQETKEPSEDDDDDEDTDDWYS